MQEDKNKIEANIVFNRTYKNPQKNEMTINIQLSDIVLQQYGGLHQELLNEPIILMQLRQKKPDKKLPFYQSFFAKILGIKPVHQFLLFQANQKLITLDFYDTNIIKIRIGDRYTVLNGWNRANSEIVLQDKTLEWQRGFKKEILSVKDIIDIVNKTQVCGYNALSHRGHHYSRMIWKLIISFVKLKQNK